MFILIMETKDSGSTPIEFDTHDEAIEFYKENCALFPSLITFKLFAAEPLPLPTEFQQEATKAQGELINYQLFLSQLGKRRGM